MDNSTEVKLMPNISRETYSTPATFSTTVNPIYEMIRKEDSNKSELTEVKQNDSKSAPKKYKLIVVLTIMMVILLLIIIATFALLVVTYGQLTSEHSKVLSQLDKSNDDIMIVLTQVATTQNNISRIIAQLDNRISDFISMQIRNTSLQELNCGPGPWNNVAYLNMTDPSQQCPPAWREYNTDGVRACGRPVTSEGNCSATFYFTGRQYSRVCGRVIGYQFASPDAFSHDIDGINITYGEQCNHIWSYVAGATERSSVHRGGNCPCSTEPGTVPQSFVGKSYYCESGNPADGVTFGQNARLYFDDPLWDGQQCEGTCCNGTNSPPWFSVQLPASTTDMIEVSICCDQGTDDEDIPVELIEIYVQ